MEFNDRHPRSPLLRRKATLVGIYYDTQVYSVTFPEIQQFGASGKAVHAAHLQDGDYVTNINGDGSVTFVNQGSSLVIRSKPVF